MYMYACVCVHVGRASADSPDRKSAGGLLGQLGGVDEHEFEQQLQVSHLAGQPGADHPGPGPALAFPAPPEVHQHWKGWEPTINYIR